MPTTVLPGIGDSILMVGAANASNKQQTAQIQYNNAYMQCMYAKGNQVPAFRH